MRQVVAGELTEGHARALLSAHSDDEMIRLAEKNKISIVAADSAA